MEILQSSICQMGKLSKQAANHLGLLTSKQKNQMLQAMADELLSQEATLLKANQKDLKNAQKNQLPLPSIERLTLTKEKIVSMVKGIEKVMTLPDPVGEEIQQWEQSPLNISQVRVPIGVIGIIYESRPNVTCDASILCLKSGNATLLRGGSEAIHSNQAIVEALNKGGQSAGLPVGSIQLIASTDRQAISIMARMEEYLDLIIPRGGKRLISTIVKQARMPVIKHSDGICHVYVDESCHLPMALKIVENAKAQRPSVCNAVETLLVHQKIAETFLPQLAKQLAPHSVELRGDQSSLAILGNRAIAATEDDWNCEYLDYILSIRVVDSIDTAIQHINHYGSKHSDAIVTESQSAAQQFFAEVDSAAVFHNASTRFNDGEVFGFGAEIGISTDKIHARGPMGLKELTSYKYLVSGNGAIRN